MSRSIYSPDKGDSQTGKATVPNKHWEALSFSRAKQTLGRARLQSCQTNIKEFRALAPEARDARSAETGRSPIKSRKTEQQYRHFQARRPRVQRIEFHTCRIIKWHVVDLSH